MFNVIRIPTKFSKWIRRLSQKEKAELLDMLLNIWDGMQTIPPDSILWDTLELIYGEWMNMESRNWNKPKESLIVYTSESLGTVTQDNSEHRVEYSRIEYSRVEESKYITLWEFWKVKVKQEELENLKIRYDEKDVNDLIDRLDRYIWSKWDKYKSHYLTMINWAKRDGIKEYTKQDRKEQKEREEKRKAILAEKDDLPDFTTEVKKRTIPPNEQLKKIEEMKKTIFK